MHNGDYLFVLENLVKKDFKVRYRHMSLGILWSLLNPIVMMVVLSLVFTRFLPNNAIPFFPVYTLCGLISYSFFASAWVSGTISIVDNAHLIKRVPIAREILPVAAVLSNTLHLIIQIVLLLLVTLALGLPVSVQWLWLPVIYLLLVIFVCGLSLLTAAINVYVRDTRYIVESINTILFWLVPIFYSLALVPREYVDLFALNPITANVLALRKVLLEASPPPTPLMLKFVAVSVGSVLAGVVAFRACRSKFYEHI